MRSARSPRLFPAPRPLASALALLALAALGSRALAQGSDACATAQPIAGLGPHAFDTSAATTGTEGQVVSCSPAGLGIDFDVWYLWTAPQAGLVRFHTCGQTVSDTKIAVYPASGGCPFTNPIACGDDECAVQSQTTFNTSAGDAWLIQVGSPPFGSGGIGTFAFEYVPQTMPNDCGAPRAIAGPGPHFFDNSLATTGTQGQSNPGCVAPKNDLWFTWVAPASGAATLSLCGQTALDSVVAVYAGAGCPAANAIACDDDGCALQSLTSWNAVAGATYTLQIGGAGITGGIGTFTVEVALPPANDDCATPLAISGEGAFPFDLSLATTGAAGQSNPCGGVDRDLWFEWTSPASGLATVETCFQTNLDTSLAVHAAGGCPGGPSSACDDDACAPESSLSFAATSGTSYLLQVGVRAGANGGPGSFTIAVSVPQPSPFCFGDGSDPNQVACPCGNTGAPGRGCASSIGASALLASSGSTNPDTLTLQASDMLATATHIYLQGNAALANGAVFGDGVRCVGGQLLRLAVKTAVGGASQYPDPNAGDLSITARCAQLGFPIGPGETRWYQTYYRDPDLAFCPNPPGNSWNVTNGVVVPWP